MDLIPFESDESSVDDSDPVDVSPVDVAGNNRDQILEALELNRQLLHDPQPGAEVDEAALRAKIDDLLDRLGAPGRS